jgi:hypothetical protein
LIAERDKAWLAGVLDLKGAVVRKHNKQRATPQLVLMMESRNFAVVRRVAVLTGSTTTMRTQRNPQDWLRRGCAEHCPAKHVHSHLASAGMPALARWTITGAGAGIVLYNILQYMQVDDRGFEEMMTETLANAVWHGPGSGAVKAVTRRLMTLGWLVPPAILQVMLDTEPSAPTAPTQPAHTLAQHPVT